MGVYFVYAIRETLGNLWRNRMMTIAAVLTVAVSLSLVGGALLLKQSAAQASVDWQEGTRVTVWVAADATPSEITAIGTQLKSMDIVKNCKFFSQAADYKQATQILDRAMSQVLTVKSVPSSYQCTPVVPSDTYTVEQTFTNQPHIYAVTGPNQEIKSMNHVIRVLQIVFLALAAVLLLSALVLILNTIRMAIFSRRREVSVMKLVGATNWFIRVPYITEGFIQGLLGSAVAIGLVSLAKVFYPLHNEFALNSSALLGTNLVVLIVGVLIGSVGSGIAIRRFLDV
ncbi:MAG TPA: permease-like cell division protein FtsX [Acidimicrobiales bacterium]|nr:permease-like cell division protein FtsX [Acidimicrobiales bacterium]